MSISITIFNPGIYSPGSDLEGKVVCTFNSRKDIRGIRLKVVGQEHTSWTKSESHYDSLSKKTKRRRVHYSGDNKFLIIQETLHSAGLIDHGKHEFTFRFVLPTNIPSTFKGSHGDIRYYLKANVDIPNAFDYEDEKIFIVKGPVNLNDMLDSLQLNPTKYQDETNLCCCCCASDPITLDVSLEKEAFVIGERIKTKIHIVNMSNDTFEKIKVQLIRRITEKCTSPKTDKRTNTEILLSNENTGVGAHGAKDFTSELLISNESDIHNFTSCKLFSQEFQIKLELVVPGCHSNIETKIPVVIGHIPVNYARNTLPVSVVSSPGSSSAGHNSSSVHGKPVKYPSGAPSGSIAPYPVANAPIDESAPSAPTKAVLTAKDDDFCLIDDEDCTGSDEPPPPSYYEAIRKH